jgi:protein-S-isoprenylcysteine O-methyltransferase Ste14
MRRARRSSASLQAPMDSKSRPPSSVSSFGLNMLGVLGVLVALYFLREQHLTGTNAVLILCAAGVVPIILLDVLVLRVHRRPSTGLDWDQPAKSDLGRVATKLLGLGLTVGLIALAYWAFAEYRAMDHEKDFYYPFYTVMRRFGGTLALLAVFYVWLVDGQMKEPRDSYWQLGRCVLLRFSDARKADIANHFRGWLVKAFYIPLFVVYIHGQINGLINWNLGNFQADNLRLYDFLNDLVYGLDVLFATVGYCLSLRVIDAHLRTAEPTMFGWVVALECYDPFWRGLFQRQYLHYEGIGFGAWLGDHVNLRWCWVAMILSCDLVYVLATFAFGVRFSNLTHRGILTNGPYRFTKHPAYVAKNISWWLITVPFIPNRGFAEAVRNSLLLGGVNMIYFLRAKTEERHLSRDPTYVAYALWMNDHGMLSFLGRWFPLLKYKPPQAAAVPADAPPAAKAASPPVSDADADAKAEAG